jgi:small subunit ribosomal protein S8
MDNLSNMLSIIKNAAMARKPYVEVFHSNECEHVAKVLKEKGYLSEVKVFKPKDKSYKMIRLDLAYDNALPQISELKRISKPGRRVYKGSAQLRPVKSGYGMLIISTSRGIMSGEEAKVKKLGGELLCEVS